MNDMFDDLKAIKSELKKQEPKPQKKKLAKNISQKSAMEEKEKELRSDFLNYMKNTEVKKI